MLPLNQNITVNTGDTITTSYSLTMPGTHAAATVTVPTAFTEVDIACTDGTSYTLVVPARNSSGYQTNNQVYTIAANDNSTQTSSVYSVTNPGCSNGAPGQTTGTYFFALGKSNPGAGNPGLAGFSTTNGLPASGVTDPINVTFNLADSTTSQGGTWAPWTTLNWHNPYSCKPPGCPLTPTITWSAPATMLSGTPSELRAVECNGVVHAAFRVYRPGTSGLLTTAPIPGTWSYNPPAGTVLSPGMNTITATFTPTNVITASTTAGKRLQNLHCRDCVGADPRRYSDHYGHRGFEQGRRRIPDGRHRQEHRQCYGTERSTDVSDAGLGKRLSNAGIARRHYERRLGIGHSHFPVLSRSRWSRGRGEVVWHLHWRNLWRLVPRNPALTHS